MYFYQILLVLTASATCVVATPFVEGRSSPASVADFMELQRAAKLSAGAYLGCQAASQDIIITMQLNNAKTDTQGFIGYSTTKQRITVAMRGSTTVMDGLNDINVIPVTPRLTGVNFTSDIQIMAGIFTPWASVHDQVITEVKRLIALYPTYTLESTGHSLGGSLTYLSYIALAQNFPGKTITSYAMAAFPIGNEAFANFGTAQQGTLNRGNNVGDGVPLTAFLNVGTPPFSHYGTEFYGYGTAATTLKCTGERDITCSAGNGAFGVTAGHSFVFGVSLIGSTCTG